MNRVFLHYRRRLSLIKLLFIFLALFGIYGFYKNGIILYINGYSNILMMFKPIYMILISLLVSFLFSNIYKEKFANFRLLSNIMIALVAMYNMNLIIYTVLILVVNGLNKFIKFNITSLFMILSIIVSMIFKNYSFANAMESLNVFSYSFFDYLLGKGIGGVGNTFLFLIIICFGILTFNIEYKKQIPTLFLITFYILITIKSFIIGSVDINLFLNNNLLFGVVFMLPLSIYSPYYRGAIYIYSILMGILTFILSFINVDLAIYITIFLGSILYKYFDKLLVR